MGPQGACLLALPQSSGAQGGQQREVTQKAASKVQAEPRVCLAPKPSLPTEWHCAHPSLPAKGQAPRAGCRHAGPHVLGVGHMWTCFRGTRPAAAAVGLRGGCAAPCSRRGPAAPVSLAGVFTRAGFCLSFRHMQVSVCLRFSALTPNSYSACD